MKFFRSKFFKIVVVLFLLTLVLATFVVPGIVRGVAEQKFIEALASEFHGRVRLRDFQLSLWDASVEVAGLALTDGRYEDVDLSFECDSLFVDADWSLLWDEVKVVDILRVEGVKARAATRDVETDQDAGSGAVPPKQTSGSATDLKFLLRDLAVDGEIQVAHRQGDAVIERVLTLREVRLTNVGTAPGLTGVVRVDIVDDKGGTVQADLAHAGLLDGKLSGSLKADFNLAGISPLTAPYWRGEILSGHLNCDLRYGTDQQAGEGELLVRNLALRANGEERNFLTVESIRADAKASTEGLEFSRVFLEAPELSLRRRIDGTFTIDQLLKSPAASTAKNENGNGQNKNPSPVLSGFKLRVDEFVGSEVYVEIDDPANGIETLALVGDVRVTGLQWPELKQPATLKAELEIRHADMQAIATVEGALRSIEPVSVQASVRGESFGAGMFAETIRKASGITMKEGEAKFEGEVSWSPAAWVASLGMQATKAIQADDAEGRALSLNGFSFQWKGDQTAIKELSWTAEGGVLTLPESREPLRVKQCTGRVENTAWQSGGEPGAFAVRAVMTAGGLEQILTSEGTLSSIARLDANGVYKLLPTEASAANALLPADANLKVLAGTCAVNGSYSMRGKELSVTFDAVLENIDLREGDGKTKIYTSPSTAVQGEWSTGEKNKAIVSNATLKAPVFYLKRNADESMAYEHYFPKVKGASSGNGAGNNGTGNNGGSSATASTASPLRLDAVSIRNGTVRFDDLSVAPGTIYQFRDLQLDLKRTDAATGGDLYNVQMNCATVGSERPGALRLKLDLTRDLAGLHSFDGLLEAESLDLKPLSPYTEKRNKVKIRHGELIAKADLKCRDDKLNSRAVIAVSEVEVDKQGLGVAGELFSVAADVLFFFLKDTRGYLGVDTKITGTLQNPDYGLDKALKKTIDQGALAHLEKALQFVKDSGLGGLGDAGGRLTKDVDGILRLVKDVLPNGGKTIEQVEGILKKLPVPLPWNSKKSDPPAKDPDPSPDPD